MADRLYIRPMVFAASPQTEAGSQGLGAVRLAGGLVWASRFALLHRRADGAIARELVSAGDMPAALARLPESVAAQGTAQWAGLTRARSPLVCGHQRIPLDQPQVMGILNVTPDSFSDGGRHGHDVDTAVAHAAGMLAAGAAIIDVGGESTRPGAAPVWEADELARVIPVVATLAHTGAAISIDTRRASVMEMALAAGAHIINDVSALRHDARASALAARTGAPVVLMHAPGNAAGGGADLHRGAPYADVLLDVFDGLREARDAALAAGISPERIVLDPGIGFGKSLAENLALMNGLALIHALGHPLLVGASRKRMIGALSAEAPADQRLGGSIMLAAAAMAVGVQIIRVHDVAETVQAARVWRGLRDAALSDFSGVADG